nr:MAG TPA: hypothetical protein [Bacteriophage sp.]
MLGIIVPYINNSLNTERRFCRIIEYEKYSKILLKCLQKFSIVLL